MDFMKYDALNVNLAKIPGKFCELSLNKIISLSEYEKEVIATNDRSK